MSVRTMSLVFEYNMPELKTDDGRTVPDSTAKFVLLALADHCNDDGEGAYIGVKRICKKTNFSSQTVCNALNALRHNGYTTLQPEPSKSGTNNYTINLDRLSQPLGFQPLESCDSSHQNPTILAARVKPSVNHKIKPLSRELSEKDKQEANSLMDAILEGQKKVKYQNRDKLPEPYLFYADLYNELTQQAPTKRDLMDWMATFEDWKQKGLQPEHIRAAYEYASRPGGGFPVGRPGSLTTTAVGMRSKSLTSPATTRPEQVRYQPRQEGPYVPNPRSR